jgi:hypothetical protein
MEASQKHIPTFYCNLAPKSDFMRTVLLVILICFAFGIKAQDQDALHQQLTNQRFETMRSLLDYRFKGGSGEFERMFLKTAEYTDEARKNCVVGTVIMTFTVSCDNVISELKFRNPMHYGLNETLQQFMEATEGMWNECQDEKYTRFEIPVLFTLKNTETNARGFITLVGDSPGFTCRSDSYYLERFEKYKAKGKKKKALEMLDQLMHRDPYNTRFHDLKRELLNTKSE